MSGAIGEYVHLRTEDYQIFDIGRKQKKIGAEAALNKHHKTLSKQVSNNRPFNKKYLEAIEDSMKGLMFSGRKVNDEKKSIKTNEQNSKAVLEGFDKGVDEEFNGGEKVKKTSKNTHVDKIKIKNQETIRSTTIEKRLKELERIINAVLDGNKNNILTAEEFNFLFKSREKLNKEYNSLKDQFNNLEGQDYKISEKGKDDDFIKKINNLIQDVRFYVSANEYGRQGEQFGRDSISAVEDSLGEYAEGLIQNAFVNGTNKVAIPINDNKVINNEVQVAEGVNLKQSLSIGKLTAKADIIVELKDFKEVGISVKNYSSKTDYHIVNATPLTTILFDQVPDFVNHFLNIFSTHINSPIEENGIKNFYMQRLKQIILIKGLQGAMKGVSNYTADYFLVVDRQHEEVKIRPIGDIVKDAIKKNAAIDNYVKVEFTPSSPEETLLKNWIETSREEDGGEKRINNLWQNAHSYKINASLKQKAFWNS